MPGCASILSQTLCWTEEAFLTKGENWKHQDHHQVGENHEIVYPDTNLKNMSNTWLGPLPSSSWGISLYGSASMDLLGSITFNFSTLPWLASVRNLRSSRSWEGATITCYKEKNHVSRVAHLVVWVPSMQQDQRGLPHPAFQNQI